MSRSLTLVFDHFRLRGSLLACDRLRLDWDDDEAFDRISAEAIPHADGVDWFDDDGLQHYKTDPAGDALTYLPAHSLIRHLEAARLSSWDRAVLAFVKALRPDTTVVLWWS